MRRPTTPRALRRVSGPSRPTRPTGGKAAARGATVHAPAAAPPRARPSRPSAPSRTRTRTRADRPRTPWRARSAAYVRALPDHALLDRVVRGRAWIPLLGILLAGIVAMQVEVLKLNAGTGRSLERASALQAQNELLRANVARLSDEQRIERIAAQMGMVMPAPEQMRFVNAGPANIQHALTQIKAPDATAFEAALPPIGQPAATQGASTNVGLGTASSTAGAGTVTSAATTGAATSATSTAASTAATAQTATTTPTQATSAPTQAATTPTQGATTPTQAITPAGAPSSTGSQSGSSSSGGATPVGG